MTGDPLSKRAVNRAGEVLADYYSDEEDQATAARTVNCWRGMHVEALQRLFSKLSCLDSIVGSALIAGRIKKLDTIVDKLRRPDTPSKLATMYDIAGCRVVLDNIRSLDKVYGMLRSHSACDVQKSERRDYIAHPKKSGYRGRHLIFSFPCEQSGTILFAELSSG